MSGNFNYINSVRLCNNGNNFRKRNNRHGITNSDFLLLQARTRRRSLEDVVLQIRQKERPSGEYRHILYSFKEKIKGKRRVG